VRIAAAAAATAAPVLIIIIIFINIVIDTIKVSAVKKLYLVQYASLSI